MFHTVVASQESAYIAGLIAAFTPCMLVLIPIFLYRFGLWGNNVTGKRKSKLFAELALLLAGFFISFILSGIAFERLLGSDYVNITRLFVGSLLVFLGILQFRGSVDFTIISKLTNPFLLGLVLPWIISFSPCVLPFVSTLLISSETSSIVDFSVVTRFVLFGAGILTPSIVIAIVGNYGLGVAKTLSKKLRYIDKIAPVLLILAGFYLSSQMVYLTSKDVLIVGLLWISIILYIFYRVFLKSGGKYSTVWNYTFLGISVVLIIVAVLNGTSLALPYSEQVYGRQLMYACIPATSKDLVMALQESLPFHLLATTTAMWWTSHRKKSRSVRFQY